MRYPPILEELHKVPNSHIFPLLSTTNYQRYLLSFSLISGIVDETPFNKLLSDKGGGWLDAAIFNSDYDLLV
jgi:hypothetical protein